MTNHVLAQEDYPDLEADKLRFEELLKEHETLGNRLKEVEAELSDLRDKLGWHLLEVID